jgi:hypothetical protein
MARRAAITTALVGVVYAVVVPASTLGHTDHVAYLGTIARMKRGQGYYAAYRESYLFDVQTRLGRARAFRQPWIFLVWRWIPTAALFATFVGMLVVVAYVFARLSRWPLCGLAPALFLLAASRTTITEWLLVELWCAPFVAGCALAWSRQKWWLAAGLAGGAVLLRETAIVVLVAGFVLALLKRRPPLPWVVAGAVTAVAFAVHLRVAGGYTLVNGNDMVLAGTADPPRTVYEIMVWPFHHEHVVAVVLLAAWLVALFEVWTRRRDLSPVAALLVMPALGLLFDRGYWGLLATPVVAWLAAERVTDTVVSLKKRRNAAVA